ncbi:MAG: Gfo/Idh/MocA family oxidoreductase [Bacteroidales bacterium]|nr:Gfo/Idh/MocA family oxidoreductase [Bacteroidales bacterium]
MRIKWGIIGTGFIAGKFAEDYRFVNEGEIMAVASRSGDRADAFAGRYEIPRSYDGYDQLLKDPDIDVVYIATPHSEHYHNTLSALQHGKAVLCEKPAAVNALQLKEMIDAAHQENLLFMEAMWTRFLPAIQKAREWVEKGQIGNVQLIQADFGDPSPTRPQQRLYNPQLAGGALLDIGIYPLVFANTMAGAICSEIHPKATLGETGVDETTGMILRYENGALAQLTCSIKHPTSHKGLIYGSKGYIEIPDFWRARKAILKDGRKILEWTDERESAGFNYEIEEMNHLLREHKKQSEVMPPGLSLKNMEMLDDIRKRIGLVYPFEQDI